MKLRWLSFALGLVLLGGCMTTPLPHDLPSVDEAVNAFNNDVRWARWHEAAQHVEPSERGAFLRLLDDTSSPFHFTSVDELSREETAKDHSELDLFVAMEYYRLPSVKERQVRQRQHWRYDVDAKAWLVTPDISVLRTQVSSEIPEASRSTWR
jgi:hypothetical protein